MSPRHVDLPPWYVNDFYRGCKPVLSYTVNLMRSKETLKAYATVYFFRL